MRPCQFTLLGVTLEPRQHHGGLGAHPRDVFRRRCIPHPDHRVVIVYVAAELVVQRVGLRSVTMMLRLRCDWPGLQMKAITYWDDEEEDAEKGGACAQVHYEQTFTTIRA